MAAKELYDYLDTVEADKDVTLELDPQAVMTIQVKKAQVELLGDDNSSEILHFSDDPIAYINIRYDLLNESDAGTLFDIFMDTDKANGKLYSFKFDSPDGHTYVVRFNTDMSEMMNPTYYSFAQISLKVIGRIED